MQGWFFTPQTVHYCAFAVNIPPWNWMSIPDWTLWPCSSYLPKKKQCWNIRSIVVASWLDSLRYFFPPVRACPAQPELLNCSFLHVIHSPPLFPPGGVLLHFQGISANYQDSEQLHIMTASTSTVLRCKCTQEKSLLGDICCLNAAREKTTAKLGRASSGKLGHTGHKLLLCNKDNVPRITQHLENHHSDSFV